MKKYENKKLSEIQLFPNDVCEEAFKNYSTSDMELYIDGETTKIYQFIMGDLVCVYDDMQDLSNCLKAEYEQWNEEE